ncbi:hypothetical protein Hanom_Chr16g01454401 [Helianthus anomalus]
MLAETYSITMISNFLKTITNDIELISKIAPEVWAGLPFWSKMTLLYQIVPNVCNFLSFSSKPLT